MGGDERQLNPAEAASLLGWWVEAGVDVSVADQPRNWLKTPASTASIEAEPVPSAPVTREKAATLDAFHAWLRETADLPLFQAGTNRALPHGLAQAPIMLVSDLPDREHADEGRPIGAQAWELTVRMLAAIGFKADDAYVASLACFPALGARLGPEDLRRCADTMREHIGLVAPRRLLLLGDGTARAMLGQPLVQARGRIHRLGKVPAVATFHPRQLLDRPADKAHAWRDLLLLMNEEVS